MLVKLLPDVVDPSSCIAWPGQSMYTLLHSHLYNKSSCFHKAIQKSTGSLKFGKSRSILVKTLSCLLLKSIALEDQLKPLSALYHTRGRFRIRILCKLEIINMSMRNGAMLSPNCTKRESRMGEDFTSPVEVVEAGAGGTVAAER